MFFHVFTWSFPVEGWEKGNFGKQGLEMGYSPYDARLSLIT
jgi:hypothetical protein